MLQNFRIIEFKKENPFFLNIPKRSKYLQKFLGLVFVVVIVEHFDAEAQVS